MLIDCDLEKCATGRGAARHVPAHAPALFGWRIAHCNVRDFSSVAARSLCSPMILLHLNAKTSFCMYALDNESITRQLHQLPFRLTYTDQQPSLGDSPAKRLRLIITCAPSVPLWPHANLPNTCADVKFCYHGSSRPSGRQHNSRRQHVTDAAL